MSTLPPPMGLLAELTHRCPLQCPYCSNPLELKRASEELDTASWQRVFGEAARLGILQLHLSGGEPAARADLETLVASASAAGLYTNLITSGLMLDESRIRALAAAGLDHVQLSFQDVDATGADHVSGLKGSLARKLAFAAHVRDARLALTVNAVVHRQNIARVPQIIALALALEAGRLEIAHVQYYGWAFANRDALLPTRAEVDAATAIVTAAREQIKGRLVIDYVTPDWYGARPKPCMGGWGRQVMVVTPNGEVWPCHAASTIPGLIFDNVRAKPLAEIWQHNHAFNAFRGTQWMPEPCQGCEHAEHDWGGCRCQALALTGNAAATDPVCELSPAHGALAEMARDAATASPPPFRYRRIGG